MLHNGNGHDANGPGPRDEDIFTQTLKGQRGVHGIPKGIKYGGHLLIHAFTMVPHIRHRHADVFCKGPGAVHPDAHRVFAEMTPASETVATPTTNNVSFCA